MLGSVYGLYAGLKRSFGRPMRWKNRWSVPMRSPSVSPRSHTTPAEYLTPFSHQGGRKCTQLPNAIIPTQRNKLTMFVKPIVPFSNVSFFSHPNTGETSLPRKNEYDPTQHCQMRYNLSHILGFHLATNIQPGICLTI